MGDAGLTGRKIIVDTYGGYSRHGGGALSGKDPTKVDRSACYMARYVAKNIVAAGLARKVEVQLAYAIGVAEPVSVMADTFGTGTIPNSQITELIRAFFQLTPKGIIDTLDLRRPIYRSTSNYGHFGRTGPGFTWERTDKADAIRKEAGSTRGRGGVAPIGIARTQISKGAFCGNSNQAERRRERYRPRGQRQAQNRMGQPAHARAAIDPQAVHQGPAAQGHAHVRLPARDQRNGQPGHHAARRRRRRGACAPRIRFRRRTTLPHRS